MPENNAILTVEGKLTAVLPKQEGEGRNGHWQRQSFVIEMQRGSFPTSVCFDVWGDQVNTLASLQIGDLLTDVGTLVCALGALHWQVELL